MSDTAPYFVACFMLYEPRIRGKDKVGFVIEMEMLLMQTLVKTFYPLKGFSNWERLYCPFQPCFYAKLFCKFKQTNEGPTRSLVNVLILLLLIN